MINAGRRGIVILGAGGHARVVIDILQASGNQPPLLAVVDADPALVGTTVWGVPVVGDDSCYERLRSDGADAAIVAIGDNALRVRLSDRVRAAGFSLVNAIHPAAMISSKVYVGRGVAVMAGSVINAGATIGDDVIINTCASVDHDCVIERGCHIAPGSHLGGGVQVGQNAFVGIGAIVVTAIRIGVGAIVGAGAVVVRDVSAGTTVVGVPARPIIRRR